MRIVRQFIPDPAAQLRAIGHLLASAPRPDAPDDEAGDDRPAPPPDRESVELRPETSDAA